MDVAICNATMRERTPSSGPGFLLTALVVIGAAYLILTHIVAKFPRR